MTLKRIFYFLSGRVYFDPQLKKIKGKTLLHITDTPKSIYPALSQLIQELKPNYIVHTGDLVDNIKLGLLPGSLRRYTRDVQPLIQLLEQSTAETIYIAIGNHDNAEVIRSLANRSKIIDAARLENIESLQWYISHYPTTKETDLPFLGASIALFGHSPNVKTVINADQTILNGLDSIHLIELDTRTVHFLAYPWGTDDHRLGKVRIRL